MVMCLFPPQTSLAHVPLSNRATVIGRSAWKNPPRTQLATVTTPVARSRRPLANVPSLKVTVILTAIARVSLPLLIVLSGDYKTGWKEKQQQKNKTKQPPPQLYFRSGADILRIIYLLIFFLKDQ